MDESLGISWNRAYLIPFVVAFLVTLVATPVIRRIAVKLDLYDRPDSGLKPHERPIPYLGGVAMYFGWLAAMAWTLPVAGVGRAGLAWVTLGGTVLMLTGLIDDLRHLRPRTRLMVQVGVAGMLVWGGIGASLGDCILSPVRQVFPEFQLGDLASKLLSWALCSFIIAGASNSTNLIDGLDGLCAGVIGISALGFLALSIFLSRTLVTADVNGAARTGLCLGLGGACLAFLIFNFNPASIFMGDSGSLLLGFNAATILILLAEHVTWKWPAAGLVVFGFPIFDTALAITRRKLNGKPLFIGDRSHFYDQLRDRGLSVRKTVLICYAIAGALAVLGGALSGLRGRYVIAVCVAMPVLALLAASRAQMLKVDDKAGSSGRK